MVYITHVHMTAAGTGHEHIGAVKWRNPAEGATGESTTATMVDWIENKGGVAKVTDGQNIASVGVVDHSYLRTHADGKWNNNLLSLPRY